MAGYTWERQEVIVSGLWEFDQSVSLEELQGFAERLNDSEVPGWGYKQIYIRRGRNGGFGIGFQYQLSGLLDPETLAVLKTPEQAREDFVAEYSNKIESCFGDQFLGWDISGPTWVLVRK